MVSGILFSFRANTISRAQKRSRSGRSLCFSLLALHVRSAFLPLRSSAILSHVHSRRSGRAFLLKKVLLFGALRLPDFKGFFKIALQCFGGCLGRVTYHGHRATSYLVRALCPCVPLQPPPRHPFTIPLRFRRSLGG